ncbi:porphobilinogen synthase [Halanaerobacter jeridensis]|uniref:Delta-aminolevulinic acid dehydratase n=1 Tax=Halanaerobacter jeridensis TaxID=706427 RepID=A0A938XTA1_9FIRM|nr:porphobilinogen synthase [Halanaerobacter jeridensis]
MRKNKSIRSLVRETELSTSDLIYPLFVVPGVEVKEEIPSMPDNYHFSLDLLLEEVAELVDLGIEGVLLFGIPKSKDEIGSRAWAKDGIVQQACRKIKDEFPELLVITDVCLCQYTSHGHCGIIEDGYVQNDATLDNLAKIALSHIEAGADMVAPSDMMDGRIQAIRTKLDQSGYQDKAIMAYSAKYASSFYGPFRDAAHSAPEEGDRSSYQMDPANSEEAMREISLDLKEGADIVMVKPALPYLDIIRRASDQFNAPLAAYNVSGEYAMIKAAAKEGWLDEEETALESLLSIKRAGAEIIITYWAKKVAKLIQ